MTSKFRPEAPLNMKSHPGGAFQPFNMMLHLGAYQPINIMLHLGAFQHYKMMTPLGAIQHFRIIPTKAITVIDWSVARLQEKFSVVCSATNAKGNQLFKEPKKQMLYSSNRSNVWQGNISFLIKIIVAVLMLSMLKCVDGKILRPTISPNARTARPCRINGQCPYPGSRKENLTRDHCFSCPGDQLPYCVTAANTPHIYYICATVAELQCDSGFFGIFTFLDGNVLIEKVACGPGTFLNGSRDCRNRKCEYMPRIDRHKYRILREATFDGIPYLLTCNAENGFCPIDATYGPNFTYTDELNYRDVCGVPATDDECVHPKGELTRDVHSNEAGNRENSAKPHVTKQKMEDKGEKGTKHLPTEQTPSVSNEQESATDTHGKGDITDNGLAAIIGSICGFLVLLAVVLVCYICKTRNKNSRKKFKTFNTNVTVNDGGVYINTARQLTMTQNSSDGPETSEAGDSHDDFEDNDDPVTEISAQPLLSAEAGEDVEDVDFGGTDPDPGSMQSV